MTWLARLAWAYAMTAAITAALLGALVPGIELSIGGSQAEAAMLSVTLGAVGATYATSGLLILRQRPRHVVGGLLLAAGALIPTEFLAFTVGLHRALLGDPIGTWLVLLAGASFWPVLILAGPAVALFFPDGRPPGPSWRWVIRVGATILALVSLSSLLRPGSVDPEQRLSDNPIGVPAMGQGFFAVLESAAIVVAVFTVLVAIGSVVVRMRRGTGEERLQLRWFVSAVVILSLLLPVALWSEGAAIFTLSLAALALVPISIVIAITRYRLYEIDQLISRTLVYVPLIGIVGGQYAASVVLLQRISLAITGDTSDAAAIISALIAGAIFTPVRKWLEMAVDKRFKPAPASPAPAVAAFSADDPAFAAAVETVVRRVRAEQRTRTRRKAGATG